MLYQHFSKIRLKFLVVLPLVCFSACKPDTAPLAKLSPPVVNVMQVEGDMLLPPVFTGTYGRRRSVPLASAQAGRVATVLVTSGQIVRKSQLLVAFDKRAAQQVVAQAQGELDAARAEAAQNATLFRRSRGLDAAGGLSTGTVEERAFAAQAARGKYVAAQASLYQAEIQLAETEVRAPEDGQIVSVSAVPGGVIGAGGEAVRLVAGEPEVHIRTLSDFPVKIGDEAQVQVQSGVPTQRIHAVVREVDAAADEATQMRGVRLVLDRPLPIAVNALVTVVFLSRPGSELVRVPLTALVQDEKSGAHVWSLTSGPQSRTVLQHVTVVGLRGADALVSGLAPGEKIVTNGADALQADQAVSSADAVSNG